MKEFITELEKCMLGKVEDGSISWLSIRSDIYEGLKLKYLKGD
jgi:hypothetical protein